MLLWSTLLCLFSATLVVSQFAKPEILADYDPNTTLQPMKNNLENQDSADNLNLIRGLLKSRQSGCPTGYGECTNQAGSCCPTGSTCCQSDGCCKAGYFCYSTGCCQTGTTGCEGNSCCTPDETCCSGGGCCESGYYCTTVSGQRGCCKNGTTCTNDSAQCQTAGYVVCTGENFCCPPSYTCFRDSAGNPKCSLSGNTSVPPTIANSNQGGPTATFVGSSSSIAKGPSTALLPPKSSSSTSSPTPSTNSNSNTNSGATSSAISIVVDAILASFAGVGAFIFLF